MSTTINNSHRVYSPGFLLSLILYPLGMATFVDAASHALAAIMGGEGPVSFADYRRLIGDGARPMECSPHVHSSGIFESYKMEDVVEELLAAQSAFLAEQPRGEMISSTTQLSSWARARLSDADRELEIPFPDTTLQEGANTLAATYFGAAPTARGQQAHMLCKNIQFLRTFRVEDVSTNEWSPELVFAAAIKLAPDVFWEQGSVLPLALLVLPLWVRATGCTGNELPTSEEEYIDMVVRQWLLRCTRRSTQGMHGLPDVQMEVSEDPAPRWPRKPTNKFNYITMEEGTTFRVMSLGDATIDGTLRGSALFNQVVAVLTDVGSRTSIPRRPRNRLKAAAKRFEQLPLQETYRSVSAQLLLRYCEHRLVPDPRTLLATENPTSVLKLIWYISRRNIPTIITLPRHSMCALNSYSLWFNALSAATVPSSAILGFPGSILSPLEKIAGDTAGEQSVSNLVAKLKQLSLDRSQQAELQTKCLSLLGCDSVEDALRTVDSVYAEAKAFAVRINAAIESLREIRLLREDILAHASNAWGAAMGCVKACAALYFALGRSDLSNKLGGSHRMIANHFAPDIYPWAHAISLCNRYLTGYAVCGSTRTEQINVTVTATSAATEVSADSADGPRELEFTADIRMPKGVRVEAGSLRLVAMPGLRSCGRCPVLISTRTESEETICTFKFVLCPAEMMAYCSNYNTEDYEEGIDVGGWGAEDEEKRNVRPRIEHVQGRSGEISSVAPGQTWAGTVLTSLTVPSREHYENCYAQVVANLNPTLKQYVVDIVRSCAAAVPKEVREATDFESLLGSWDRTVPGAMEPFAAECVVTDEEIAVAMDGQKRPPCSGFLDIDSPDGLHAAVSRFNRDDVIRIYCLMSKGGRSVVSNSGISARPSAVSMVWAILRGVNDHDWVKRNAEL